MNILNENITAYIDLLSKNGLTVTLHGEGMGENFKFYNYHASPYCHYIKAVYGKLRRCVCHQERVLEGCKEGSFFGCCYAGVGEFIYPITANGRLIGFVSVSGYLAENSLPKAAHFADKYLLPEGEIISLLRENLNPEIPKKKDIDALITPLCFMLSNYFENLKPTLPENKVFAEILGFVTENCHRKITMETLSKKFNYSISTISHMFSKNCGKSLPEYIDTLRLDEAKYYLRSGKAGISEIALFLGYSSSNYFSSVFKKKFGMTPKEYRNAKQNCSKS